MNRPEIVKLILAVLLLGLAAGLGLRFFQREGSRTDRAFFYDLSERKLFSGPRNAVPPIRGVDGAEEDAVRAMVISTNGNPADPAGRMIAYLEKYSAELKREMEAARASGGSPAMGRAEAQAHRLVQRPGDSEWYPMSSPEAERIVSAWLTAGPGGSTAVICSP
jgi:hypothetical protein